MIVCKFKDCWNSLLSPTSEATHHIYSKVKEWEKTAVQMGLIRYSRERTDIKKSGPDSNPKKSTKN